MKASWQGERTQQNLSLASVEKMDGLVKLWPGYAYLIADILLCTILNFYGFIQYVVHSAVIIVAQPQLLGLNLWRSTSPENVYHEIYIQEKSY